MIDSLRNRRRRVIKDVGGSALVALEGIIARSSLVGNRALFDPEQFDWVSGLESHWPVIRNELEGVLRDRDRLPNFQDISTDQVVITKDNKWKTYFLYGFGYKSESNCERCPETTKLIESVPGMTTAFFSILLPHKHIPEHRGLYKGFLRYHLGLIVPEPRTKCRIRIADQIVHWEEGKSLVFDDTYPHEVWNETNGLRAVLFMDIVRPLRFPGSLLNDVIIRLVRRSGYIQDARKNQERWEKQFG